MVDWVQGWWAGLEAGLNGKIVGINCVLSTDSMCKKVSFLGNITVSLDPSREGNSGVMKFLDGNIFDKIIRDTVSGCGPKERERERIHAHVILASTKYNFPRYPLI